MLFFDEEPAAEHLVATVGLNPLPVALAILTLAPSSVQLVCSTASRDEAQLITDVVSGIFAGGEFSGIAPTFLPPLIVDADDLAAASQTLDTYCATLSVPFRLDYSGGTKIMAVAAVTAHMRCHAAHPERGGQWRTIVDDSTGTVIDGAQPTFRRPINSTGLTIERIAALHGYTLTGAALSPDGIPDLSTLITDTYQALAEIDARSSTDLADNSPTRHVGLTPFAAQVTRCAKGVGVEPDPGRMNNASGVRGQMRELLVAQLLMHLAATDPDSRAALSEAMFNVKAREHDDTVDVEAPGKADAELDLVIRCGHRIASIEVKSNASDATKFVSERLIPSRWPFGSAVTSVVASAEGVYTPNPNRPQVTWTTVESTAQQLTREIPALRGKVDAWLITHPAIGDDALTRNLRTWLLSPGQNNHSVIEPGNAHPDDRRVVALAADGTPLAVKAALQWAGELRRAVAVGPNDPTTVNAFTACARAVKRADSQRTYAALTAQSEHAAYLALAPYTKALDAVVVTPGPKVLTAGMIRRALDTNANIVHIGIDGTITTLGCSGTAVLDFQPDWITELAAPQPFPQPPTVLEAELFTSATQTAPAAADAVFAALIDHLHQRAEPAQLTVYRCTTYQTHTVVIIAGTRGCASLHYWPSNKGQLTAFQTHLRAQAALLHARVGDAYKPLLILNGEKNLPHFQRYETRDRWLPILISETDTTTVELTDTAAAAVLRHLLGTTT